MGRAPLPQVDRSAVLDELSAGAHADAWRAGTTMSREQVLRAAAALAAGTRSTQSG